MRRVLRRPVPLALAAALAAVLALFAAPPASAATQIGGPFLGTTGFYDYSDSGIRDTAAGTETHWWCGDTQAHQTDTILRQQYRLSDWSVISPEQPVLQEGTAGAWDSQYTCNPTVVEGSFVNPLGDGQTYSYAMYYVGTASSSDNSIGAAFSQDGITWHKYPVPVLQFGDTGHGYYGYGQPNASIVNGRVELLFEDWDAPGAPGPGPLPAHTHAQAPAPVVGRHPVGHVKANTQTTVTQVGTHWYALANPDGVTFASPAYITSAGLPDTLTGWGGAAYDPQDGRWYAAANDGFRPASTTGGVTEQGQAGVTLYATTSLDTGIWTELDTIDTVMTGSEANFLSGLLRDPNGDLSSAFLPSVRLDVSQSWPRPAYNASGAQLGNSGAFNDWQIAWHQWTPGNPLRKLVRVAHLATAQHETTTGYYDASYYTPETSKNLGSLYEAPTGAATVPLHSCKLGATDYFVTAPNGTRSDCAGQYELGLLGYLSPTPGPGLEALYACIVPNVGGFVSTDPGCEGQQVDTLEPGGLLGYSQL